jgi:hypothetical protein
MLNQHLLESGHTLRTCYGRGKNKRLDANSIVLSKHEHMFTTTSLLISRSQLKEIKEYILEQDELDYLDFTACILEDYLDNPNVFSIQVYCSDRIEKTAFSLYANFTTCLLKTERL